ncbi:MAG: phosphoglucosamine mutase [Gammaproteobacteria bacterium]|nr:phosphoglucosamine mutase [Gammaproteobacteria bacterium]
MSARRFFGTDGIRGRVGVEPITPRTVQQLGWAAGRVFSGDARGQVLIGKDTRVSGYMLESALEAGLAAAGADVALLGPLPTPGIAYLTQSSRARAGIVISASHNPYSDNGIKFFGPDGSKLDDATEHAIEAMLDEPQVVVKSSELGKATRFSDAQGRYIEFLKSNFPAGETLGGLSLVVDCANGAAYQIAPRVFSELGARVIPLACEPDGFNINRDCGSTSPQILCDAVREHGADLGVALDGDGDRVVLVDADGTVVDGDGILYALLHARHAAGRFAGGLVGTLMTNLGLEEACAELGVAFERTAVGDRFVLERMRARGWQLGGEPSGHIILADRCATGDGTLAALEVLATLRSGNRSLAELVAGMKRYPQHTINVRLAVPGFDPDAHPVVKRALEKAQRILEGRGRVVLRASGTEPVVRVTVEAADAELVAQVSGALADSVREAASA